MKRTEYVVVFEDLMFPGVEKAVYKKSLFHLLVWIARKAPHAKRIRIVTLNPK